MKKLYLLMLCGLLCVTGCQKERESIQTPELEVEEQKEQEEDQPPEEQGHQEATEPFAVRELTKKELQDFTKWVNRKDNYGFLLSEYTEPQDVDIYQVFYGGAGIETEQLTAEEERAYLKVIGEDEIYTECTRLTTDQINELLEKKLGLSLKDMKNELEWTYLPDKDVWVLQHGDTNYMNFTCINGRQLTADTFELNCVPGDENYAPYVPGCRLTLQSYGEEYRFLSNIYVAGLEYSKDIWKNDEQSFDVNLEGWGDVTFATYEPDTSAFGNPDVTFSLIQNGNMVYEFPAVSEDNYRRGEVFVQVLSVSFKDYDKDGDTDVIILAEYKPESDLEEALSETYVEARLYRNQPENAVFILDEKMDYLNYNGWNHTIQEVMDHIDEAGFTREE